MPCKSDYMDDHKPTIVYRDAPEALKVEIDNLKGYLDQTTRLLCAVCKYLDSEGYAGYDKTFQDIENGELTRWWAQHKEADRIREEREIRKLREGALAKLTTQEQRVLGLISSDT